MSASESYRAGRLDEAIASQVAEVKANPADQSRRLFLFELLAFSGDLDRARRQIDALRFDDNDLALAVESYRKLLDAEQLRRRLFSEGLIPSFLGEPVEHLRLRLEAVNRLREGHGAEALGLLARADEATPPVRGKLNGQAFHTLRDADDLFSGVLEVMAQGKYFWVALEQVTTLAMNPPRFSRDLLYAPARIELESEAGDIFLPALYPGSYEHADDQVKLGRMTDWKEIEGGPTLGVGLRTFLRDDDGIALLDFREFQALDDQSASPADS